MKRVEKSWAKRGFTLVELALVALLVAVLAAAAVPLMSGNQTRAMMTEAEAALGTPRSALRAMAAETRAYNQLPTGGRLEAGMALSEIPGIRETELAGRYFQASDYSIREIGETTYVIQALGSEGPVEGILITLDQDGVFTRGRVDRSGGGTPPPADDGGDDGPPPGNPPGPPPRPRLPPEPGPEPPFTPPWPPVQPPGKPPFVPQPPIVPPIEQPPVM